MARSSADAQAIMNMRAAHHPKLRPVVDRLASMAHITLADAHEIIDAACQSAKISGLDIDMVQPGAQTAVPFASASNDPGDDHQQRVSLEVRRLMLVKGGKK